MNSSADAQRYSRALAHDQDRLNILYVCPLAHLEGHDSYAAASETAALASAGQKVTLLTFAGMIDLDLSENVVHISVLSSTGRIPRMLRCLNKNESSSRLFSSLATLLTLLKAVSLMKTMRYDVIHVRDATGVFMSLPQFLGVLFAGNTWLVSLLDTEEKGSVVGGLLRMTKTRTLYQSSFRKNSYAYLCQKESTYRFYSERFLGGLLDGKVWLLPPFVPEATWTDTTKTSGSVETHTPAENARTTFLSFGALHAGKDLTTVCQAIMEVPGASLLHIGRTNPKLADAFRDLQRRYSSERITFRDGFVPESSKPVIFGAAAAVILSYTRNFGASASMLWEAARFHVPVIASDNDQLSALVSKYNLGLLFRAQDSKSLEEAVSNFLALSPSEIAAFRRNSYAFCEAYASSSWAKKCIQIYETLCRSASPTDLL
jgi:glycosyltransferase involved in cell wall biosynthesis